MSTPQQIVTPPKPPVLLATTLIPLGLTFATVGVVLLIDAFAPVSDSTYTVVWIAALVGAPLGAALAGLRRRQSKPLVAVFALASLLIAFWVTLFIFLTIYILTPNQTWYCC